MSVEHIYTDAEIGVLRVDGTYQACIAASGRSWARMGTVLLSDFMPWLEKGELRMYPQMSSSVELSKNRLIQEVWCEAQEF